MSKNVLRREISPLQYCTYNSHPRYGGEKKDPSWRELTTGVQIAARQLDRTVPLHFAFILFFCK